MIWFKVLKSKNESQADVPWHQASDYEIKMLEDLGYKGEDSFMIFHKTGQVFEATTKEPVFKADAETILQKVAFLLGKHKRYKSIGDGYLEEIEDLFYSNGFLLPK